MRGISLSTLDRYRKNAKHDANIPNDVLKIKLNCLIDSVEKEHIYTRGNSTIYQFGRCMLFVTDNIVTDIRWTDEDTKPTNFEVRKMTSLFLRNGLNKNGNKYLNKVINISKEE